VITDIRGLGRKRMSRSGFRAAGLSGRVFDQNFNSTQNSLVQGNSTRLLIREVPGFRSASR